MELGRHSRASTLCRSLKRAILLEDGKGLVDFGQEDRRTRIALIEANVVVILIERVTQ